jgi:hypothetical protein
MKASEAKRLAAPLLVCWMIVAAVCLALAMEARGQNPYLIGRGNAANDDEGTDLRTAAGMVNSNFLALWRQVFTNGALSSLGASNDLVKPLIAPTLTNLFAIEAGEGMSFTMTPTSIVFNASGGGGGATNAVTKFNLLTNAFQHLEITTNAGSAPNLTTNGVGSSATNYVNLPFAGPAVIGVLHSNDFQRLDRAITNGAPNHFAVVNNQLLIKNGAVITNLVVDSSAGFAGSLVMRADGNPYVSFNQGTDGVFTFAHTTGGNNARIFPGGRWAFLKDVTNSATVYFPALTASLPLVLDANNAVTAAQLATAQIADDAVTYGKMQDVSAASKLLGRGDSGSGIVQEITLGSGLSMSGTTLSASGGGGGATNALTQLQGMTNAQQWLAIGSIAGASFTWTTNGAGANATNTLNVPADIIMASEVDTAAEVNALVGDDDFVTLAGSQSISGAKTFGLGSTLLMEALTASRPLKLNGSKFVTSGFIDVSSANDITGEIGTGNIANDAVTYAKIQNVAVGSALLGRGDSGAGDVQQITLGTGFSMSGTTLNFTETGDFGGPASSTDNAVVRFNGTTGKLGQNSGVIIDDTNGVSIPGGLAAHHVQSTNGFASLGNGSLPGILELYESNQTHFVSHRAAEQLAGKQHFHWYSNAVANGSIAVLVATNQNGSNFHVGARLITGTGHLVASNAPTINSPTIIGTAVIDGATFNAAIDFLDGIDVRGISRMRQTLNVDGLLSGDSARFTNAIRGDSTMTLAGLLSADSGRISNAFRLDGALTAGSTARFNTIQVTNAVQLDGTVTAAGTVNLADGVVTNNVKWLFGADLAPASQLTNYTADFSFGTRRKALTNDFHISAVSNLPTDGVKPWMAVLRNFSGSTWTVSVDPSMPRSGTNWVEVASAKQCVINIVPDGSGGTDKTNTIVSITLAESP